MNLGLPLVRDKYRDQFEMKHDMMKEVAGIVLLCV